MTEVSHIIPHKKWSEQLGRETRTSSSYQRRRHCPAFSKIQQFSHLSGVYSNIESIKVLVHFFEENLLQFNFQVIWVGIGEICRPFHLAGTCVPPCTTLGTILLQIIIKQFHTSPKWGIKNFFVQGQTHRNPPREWATGNKSRGLKAMNDFTSVYIVHMTTPKVGQYLKSY